MKKFAWRPKAVEVPWYMPMTFEFRTGTLRIGYLPWIKDQTERAWFAVPRSIFDRQIRECQNFIPDYRKVDGSLGDKFRTIFGFYVDLPEGEALSWNWFKYIKRI